MKNLIITHERLKSAINFSYRFLINTLSNCRPKEVRQYCIISKLDVLNNFIHNPFTCTTKSNDCRDLLSRLQTSNTYNRICKHLYFKSCITTSSEANLPTLARILFEMFD